MISPGLESELHDKLTAQNTDVFALDCVPRMLSRAQTYDVLSSQANIAGYRSIIEAAEQFPRFFAGQMTAAGKVPPAKVLVVSKEGHTTAIVFISVAWECISFTIFNMFDPFCFIARK
jgi:NAD/NADP transhydrogenase alpha subunit